eukprot:8432547-Pyramimonas_sp.AAC.1
MPSTAPPGKSNDEVECDLMFYEQEQHISCHPSLYSICHWNRDTRQNDTQHLRFIPSKDLYSDGEGAVNNDTAKSVFKAKGTERRIRARGQHATTTEARNGILCHLLHAIETELN